MRTAHDNFAKKKAKVEMRTVKKTLKLYVRGFEVVRSTKKEIGTHKGCFLGAYRLWRYIASSENRAKVLKDKLIR